MNFLDAYIDDPSDLTEGLAPDQVYARVPVIDDKGKRLTWLVRLTEDQYRELDGKGRLTAWKDLAKAAKRTIKDKAAKDKEIPTITFGGALVSPGSPVLTTDAVEIPADAKPVEKPTAAAVAPLPPPVEERC